MTTTEYDAKIRAYNEECKNKIRNLQNIYAESNNPVRIGDIITDHFHTIKVKSWKVAFCALEEYPCLVYQGTQYTKTGNVAKRQTDTEMWQSNIKFINGKAIK